MISLSLNGVGSASLENIFYLSLKDTDFLITNLSTNTYLLALTNDYTKKQMITMINPNILNAAIPVNDIYAIRLTDFSNTSTIPDATRGQTKFDDLDFPPGSYSYKVYQQNSRTNLDLESVEVHGVIETGKAFVTSKIQEVFYREYTGTDNDTNITYVQ